MAVPTNLVATPVSDTQIDVSWDDMGVVGYDVEVVQPLLDENGAPLFIEGGDYLLAEEPIETILDHPTNSYSDVGLVAGQQRFYRVRSVLAGAAVGPVMLGDFDDVDTTGAGDGDELTFDGTTSEWKPA